MGKKWPKYQFSVIFYRVRKPPISYNVVCIPKDDELKAFFWEFGCKYLFSKCLQKKGLSKLVMPQYV